MLEDHQVSPHNRSGTMLCKSAFKNIIINWSRNRIISSDSRRWYCALLTAFLSNLTILSLSKRLQFLLTVSSEERMSYRLRKSLKRLVRSGSLEDMSLILISSSINSSFEWFSSWLLVRTIMIYKYRWQYRNQVELNLNFKFKNGEGRNDIYSSARIRDLPYLE